MGFVPFVILAGASLESESLGNFWANSVRVENFSNQWLLEQSAQAWIPPYTVGRVIRLNPAVSVAQITNRSPSPDFGQASVIDGEHTDVYYFDIFQPDVSGFVIAPPQPFAVDTVQFDAPMDGSIAGISAAPPLNGFVLVTGWDATVVNVSGAAFRTYFQIVDGSSVIYANEAGTSSVAGDKDHLQRSGIQLAGSIGNTVSARFTNGQAGISQVMAVSYRILVP